MSRNPQFQYDYPANVDPSYYLDEHEGFVADYSDSDCIPDTVRRSLHTTIPAPPHLSEIYGKHSTILPVKVVPFNQTPQMIAKQHSEQFIQEAYCDGNIVNASDISQSRPCYSDICRVPRNFYPTSTASQHDASYSTKAFRSAHHNFEQFEHYNCQSCQASKSLNPKRLPITVRTPKYYKKSLASGVFKRPSALCLPVAVQPDPAVMRRPKKNTLTDTAYGMQDTQGTDSRTDVANKTSRKKINEQEFPHRVDSQGDLNASVKLPPFDEFLEQIENGHFHTQKDNSKPDKITKFLKPRIPATIKARQEKQKAKTTTLNKKTSPIKQEDANKKQNNQDTTKSPQISLEKLLQQLKKCELSTEKSTTNKETEETQSNKVQNQQNQQNKNSNEERGEEKSDITDDEKFNSKSFNYQDITQNLFKSQCDSESVASIQDITKKLTSTNVRPQPINPIKPLDDHCALELHKSKSYIVNLIDRALSKELGTVPGERNQKEFNAMNPKKAIETVTRHLGKSERDISVEITNALTDSLISNVTSRDIEEERDEKCSKGKFCCCNSEEPIYIKQLKQLRWGHLKHIQREVKRLEDLERFLDSCSITTIPEL